MKAKFVGKSIIDYRARPFRDGHGRGSDDPVIVLNDGSYLTFGVEETEREYGVKVYHLPAQQHSFQGGAGPGGSLCDTGADGTRARCLLPRAAHRPDRAGKP